MAESRVAIRDGRIVRLKVCVDCGQEKVCDVPELSEFYVSRSWPDGRPRWWEARCKECRKAQKRTDEYRAKQRAAHRRRRAQRQQIEKAFARNRLPLGPFQAWLKAYAEARGVDNCEDLGFELGLIPRRVRHFVEGKQQHVAVFQVDKALTNAAQYVDVNGRTIFTITDLYEDYFRSEAA